MIPISNAMSIVWIEKLGGFLAAGRHIAVNPYSLAVYDAGQ